MLLRIGELAKRSGLTVRTLHHYDHIGLLSPSGRSESGYRLYDREDVVRLHRIQALKQFGCPLSDIKAFLEEPGASIVDILTQQMKTLEDQALSARALHDRLFRLREQLSRGENTGLTDWLSILEMMTMYEKHLSKKEIDTLFSKKAPGRLEEECNQIISLARNLMDRGIPPERKETQELAWRWIRLWREATDNDAVLALKLRRIHREEQASFFKGITPQIVEYLIRSFASARATLLARYLSPAEVEEVRVRQAAHLFEWPPLIAEIQQQMTSGATPFDPAVQTLARRWDRLFRASFAADNLELEGKIRSAFQQEPDLRVGIGVDASLIAFVEKAVLHFKNTSPREGNPSAMPPKPTALRVATLRAVHQMLDSPVVFDDPLALKILGEAEEKALRHDLARYDTPLLRGLRTSVAVRSRLAEEEWGRAKARGVRQYVILGAGLDTFAYRDRDRDGSRIFEVDLPATQQWKRELLRAAGIAEPASATYVPADFERETLAEALEKAGFSLEAPAFFSWLGVTMYLEEKAIVRTWRYIASLPPGSGVVFDYAVAPSLLSLRERRAFEALAARTAEGGEPWKTSFEPDSLAATLHSQGFAVVETHGPERLNERYLSGRTDGLRKSGVSRLVCAWV